MGTVSAAALATPPALGASGATVEVQVHEGLLTLQASGAPLVEVIRTIGGEAGFETVVYGELDVELTRTMNAVPLEEALHQLLRGVSNVMRFEDVQSLRLTEVQLFGNTNSYGSASDSFPESRESAAIVGPLDAERAGQITAIGERAEEGDLLAIEELSALLHDDPDPAVRSRAARALGRTGDQAAVPSLRTGVQDGEQTVRLGSIRALAAIKSDQATQVLADLLFSHPDTRTRLLAVWALGEQDSPLARSYLQAAKADGDSLVQQAVARSQQSGQLVPGDTDEGQAVAESESEGSEVSGKANNGLSKQRPAKE